MECGLLSCLGASTGWDGMKWDEMAKTDVSVLNVFFYPGIKLNLPRRCCSRVSPSLEI
jgi:hypothetical protein